MLKFHFFRFVYLFCFFVPTLLFAETKINDVQILATHNSFKEYIDEDIRAMIESICSLNELGLVDYQQLPLKDQLDKGVRGIELDIFADPEGGRFREHRLLSLMGEDGQSHDPELDKPGFKVIHDINFDFQTRCTRFVGCLSQILEWSNAHPNHLPIFMHVQVRDEPTPIIGNFLKSIDLVQPLTATKILLDALDQEIRDTIPLGQIIAPDQVRGNFTTLREAVLADAWPNLVDSRGKFVFYMDARPGVRDMYLEDHPQLNGRIIFTAPEDPNADDAAFLIMNSPVEDGQKIKELVSLGFIVRTRADSGTREAYANDKRTWNAALLSGAQIVSTDYVVPDPITGADYYVFIPNGNPGRCNPVRELFCDARTISE